MTVGVVSYWVETRNPTRKHHPSKMFAVMRRTAKTSRFVALYDNEFDAREICTTLNLKARREVV